jgi:beta-lactamase superfamily II metal-dependent hydrolase
MFRIEMLPAGHGDSLLIAYGSAQSPSYILIDGGPYYFYANKSKNEIGKRQTLARRLTELARSGARLELMVVSHIDGDHIEALVKWIGSYPDTLQMNDLWFNGRQHLEPGWLGVPEGEFLAKLIDQHQLPWNRAFQGGPVAARPDRLVEAVLAGGMKIMILSPTPEKLIMLRTEWDKVLAEEKLDTDDPQQILERLAQNKRLQPEAGSAGWLGAAVDVEEKAEAEFDEDDTAANGSSIAFLAEYEDEGAQKSVLFTGDAHPNTLAKSIRQLLRKRGLSTLALDAIKIPHHGSKNNLNRELLELLECRRYFISTNGSYFNHPDQEAIARILKYGTAVYSKNRFDKAELCFNYHKPRVAVWEDAELKSRYQYETVFPAVSGDGLVVDL